MPFVAVAAYVLRCTRVLHCLSCLHEACCCCMLRYRKMLVAFVSSRGSLQCWQSDWTTKLSMPSGVQGGMVFTCGFTPPSISQYKVVRGMT